MWVVVIYKNNSISAEVKSENHRMVWTGKGIIDHLIPTPICEQGHLLLGQIAQSPIQLGLGHFQGWASTASVGTCASASPLPQEKVSSYITNLNLHS